MQEENKAKVEYLITESSWLSYLFLIFSKHYNINIYLKTSTIKSQGVGFAAMKNVTSISLWLNQEYNFILTPWILACLAGAWKYYVRKNGVNDGNMCSGDT